MLYICSNVKKCDPKSILFYSADRDYSNDIDETEFRHILNKMKITYT